MQHDRSSRSETIPLIPRRVLFGNPDRTSPQISPDGARLAFLAPVDGVLNVWVGPADDPKAASPVTEDRERGIRIYFWAYTSRHVLYLQDRAGDEDWHVYSVDLDAGKTIDLTPLEGVHAQIQGVSHRFPQEVVVGLNDRDPAYHDLYRVDILTAERTLIQRNDDFAELLIDDDYRVRLGARITPDGGSDLFMLDGEGSWQPFMKVEMEDLFTTMPFDFDKTGGALYMIDSRGRDTSAMSAIDLDTGEETLIAEDARVDVSDVMLHPVDNDVQAVAFTYERKRWQVIDNGISADFERLRSVADGDIEVVSRTLDDRTWIVAYLVDDGPVRYYRYDRGTGRADFLFTNRSELEGLPLASMRPVVIETRDGLEMVCYYTLPIGERQGPLPMVLNVHGGPWGRDDWGYDPIHQHLANRGYVVLSVNFLGSSGLGKGFMNAANLELGRQDAGRPGRRGGVGRRRGHCRSRASRDRGRQLRRLRRSRRPHNDARCLLLRRGPRRAVQPDHHGRDDPALLEAGNRDGGDPRRRLQDRRGPGAPDRAVAADARGPDRQASADRPRGERRTGQTGGVGPDCRCDEGEGHTRNLSSLP